MHEALRIPAILLTVLIATAVGGIFSVSPGNISTLWPANALLFSAVFLLPDKRRLCLLLAWPAYLLAELWIGFPLLNSALYGAANVIEVGVLVWLLKRAGIHALAFDSLRNLYVFIALASLASLAGGAIGAAGATLAGAPFGEVFLRWTLADFFGYCLCVPVILAWAARRKTQLAWPGAARMLESLALTTAVLGGAMIFYGPGLPGSPAGIAENQLLIVPILLWAALRFGPIGGSASIVAVACIAFFSATHGLGPFGLGTAEHNVAALQWFFLALVLSVMTVASLDAERRKSFATIIAERDLNQRMVVELRQVQEALRKSETLLNAAQELAGIGGWEYDVKSGASAWTDELYRIHELPPIATIDHVRESMRCYRPEDRPVIGEAFRRACQNGEPYDLELPFKTYAGRELWIRTLAKAVREEGEIVRVVGNVMDITERKRAEEELRRLKDHLEEEVRQRTADLVLARNAAEAANLAKSVFLSNMSHELRTPLNAILGFSRIVRRDSSLPASARENLDIVVRSGERLLALINDVLEMAKIETGRVQLESAAFDLGASVRDVAEMMRLRAQDKGLRLSVETAPDLPRYVVGDESRLRQVLINLVDNAIKFTQSGGVVVRLATKQGPPLHLLIEVEDSGPGIAAGDSRRIFEPFVQLGEHGVNGGTGLGLSITRKFVEMMGGNITVKSQPGEGSLFLVELPLTAALEGDVAQGEAPVGSKVVGLAPGQPAWRVLIVENQRDNQLLLSKLMEAIGLQVKVAEKGDQGVREYQRWRPDLIWMDLRMPGMDGLEATRRIRALPGGAEVKIVAVTASSFVESREELLDTGIDDFISKPYRNDEIYDCLARQLGLRYVCETVSAPKEAGTMKQEMIAELPAGLREELKGALLGLEVGRIDQVIRRIAACSPELGKTLAQLAEDYNYAPILRSMESMEAAQRRG